MIKTKIREVMARRGIKTQKALSEMSGLSENTIASILSDTPAIRTESIDRLCKALDCQPGDLLEYVSDKK